MRGLSVYYLFIYLLYHFVLNYVVLSYTKVYYNTRDLVVVSPISRYPLIRCSPTPV